MHNRYRFYLITSFSYLFLLTSALLFPFSFRDPVSIIESNVKRLSGYHGIEVLSNSLIVSSSPPNGLYGALVKGDGLTLEIWLSVKDIRQKGPARILSYSYNKYLRNFTLGQSGKDLVLRLRTTETDLDGPPQWEVKKVFTANRLQHIVVTYNYLQKKLFVNGRLFLKPVDQTGSFLNWDPKYHLIIANEATGNRPWLGKLYRAAIYSRALSGAEVLQHYREGAAKGHIAESKIEGLAALYDFSEKGGYEIRDQSGLRPAANLQIQKKIKVTDKVFLRVPYENFTLNIGNLKDIILNVACFIPLGYFFYILIKYRYQSHKKSILLIIICGGFYTLSIETVQYFLKSRVSSLTDSVNNMIGIMLGIMLEKCFESRLTRIFHE